MTQQNDENEIHGRTLHDPGPGKVMPHAPTTLGSTSEEPPDEPGKEMPHSMPTSLAPTSGDAPDEPGKEMPHTPASA